MALIGLCGKPQSGKSEVRRMLETEFGFKSICSKQILYKISSEVTGLPERYFSDPFIKNDTFQGKTFREITGTLGNAVESLFGDSFLIHNGLYSIPYETSNYVVDSLRKTQTRDFKGIVVEILSERGIDTGSDFDTYDRSRIDYQLSNVGNFEMLRKHVAIMLDKLGVTQ